ncbi:hypothetical protein [Streptomyces sp. NBC_01445]|nr:hypothetical protein [Streptomyces sp. NBC_01445]WSE02260.1 hypothetical protein OG574_01850 [Streptomyces sp. NBC_01445]
MTEPRPLTDEPTLEQQLDNAYREHAYLVAMTSGAVIAPARARYR